MQGWQRSRVGMEGPGGMFGRHRSTCKCCSLPSLSLSQLLKPGCRCPLPQGVNLNFSLLSWLGYSSWLVSRQTRLVSVISSSPGTQCPHLKEPTTKSAHRWPLSGPHSRPHLTGPGISTAKISLFLHKHSLDIRMGEAGDVEGRWSWRKCSDINQHGTSGPLPLS